MPESATNELYSVKGDRDGAWSSLNLTRTAFAHPNILWGDRLLTGDLYRMADEVFLNLYCPRCLNSIKISSTRKKIDFDPEHGLSVEPFTCPWELSNSDGREGDRISFGLGMCRWSVAIDATRREIDTNVGRVVIHGIAKNT